MKETLLQQAIRRLRIKSDVTDVYYSEHFPYLALGISKKGKNYHFPLPVDITESEFNFVDGKIRTFGSFLIDLDGLRLTSLIGQEIQISYSEATGSVFIESKGKIMLLHFSFPDQNLKLSNLNFMVLGMREASQNETEVFDRRRYEPFILTEIRKYACCYESKISKHTVTTRTVAEEAINLFGENFQFLISSNKVKMSGAELAVNDEIPDILSEKQLKNI